MKANRNTINFYEILQVDLYLLQRELQTGFANFINEWSQCDFCFTNVGVILEYLVSSIRLSSMWSWHAYTIVRDTRNSCGGLVTWKAQIHEDGDRVNFERNLPSSCFVMQYNNSLISMIYLRFTTFAINVNCICCKRGKDKTVFVTENFWSRSDSLPNLSGVI